MALTALFAMSGCYKATFYRDPSVIKGEEHERWTDFFVFGLVGTESFDVHSFCPAGDVAQIQTGGNVGTGIIGFITLGIYTPRKIYVTCAAGSPPRPAARTQTLEIDADTDGAPVRVRLHDGTRVFPTTLACAGNQVWRISRDSEVQP